MYSIKSIFVLASVHQKRIAEECFQSGVCVLRL